MIKIIADTTSCIDPSYAGLHNVSIIPQVINFEDETFYEGVNITTFEFMQRLRSSSVLPKTAAPPPELFIQEFTKYTPNGEPILCILPSEDISGTVRAAQVAAMEFPSAPIYIFDSRTIGSPLGTLIHLASEWAEKGIKIDQIMANLKTLSGCCQIYFLVDTLEFLARGGRIGGAAALVGGLLQIKPILRLNNGRVDQFERERTHRRAIARLKDIIVEQYPKDTNGYLTLMYSGDIFSECELLADQLCRLIGQSEIQIFHLPPAIITHAGPGVIAAGFFTCQPS